MTSIRKIRIKAKRVNRWLASTLLWRKKVAAIVAVTQELLEAAQ